MAEHSEPAATEDSSSDRFSRAAATGAVLATLLGALIGFLQSEASKAGDRATADAKELSAKAFGSQIRTQQAARLQYDLYIQSQVLRARASAALEQRLLGSEPDSARLVLEQRRSDTVAAAIDRRAIRLSRSEGQPPIGANPALQPDRDPNFPSRFFAGVDHRAVELAQLADAARREGGKRGDQGSSYLAILALLAVVIYLFGFSLTPHGKENRRLFAGAATVLFATALIWATTVAAPKPRRAPPAAAAAFADARAALEASRFESAARLYTKSLGLDPELARAHYERAVAIYEAGSPERGAFSSSLTRPGARRRALTDYLAALQAGTKDPDLYGSTGFNLITVGIQAGSDDQIEAGIRISKRAQAANPSEPGSIYNLGLANLALGRFDAARKLYLHAVRATVHVRVRGKELERTPQAVSLYVSDALTDLELLRAASISPSEGELRRIKELMVRTAWGRAKGGSGHPPRSRKAEIGVTPGFVSLDLREFPWSQKDKIVAVYYRRVGKLGWATLPEAATLTSTTDPSAALYWQFDQYQRTISLRRYQLRDADPPSCLPDSDYKVELYVNGKLAQTVFHHTIPFSRYKPAVDTAIGYRLCRPRSWRPSPKALPGFVNGFVSPSGKGGVYVVQESVPPDQADAVQANPAEFVNSTIAKVVRRSKFLLPSGLHRLPQAPSLFGGLRFASNQLYAYPGGFLGAGGGLTVDNGSALVGLVFVPGKSHRGDTVRSFVFQSINFHD